MAIKKKAVLTVDDYFEMFVAEQTAKGLSDKTIDTLRFAFTYFRRYSPVDKLEDISKQAIRTFVEQRIDKVAANTINTVISHVRTFFYWLIEENIIEPFKISLIKAQEPTIRIYTDEELGKLIQKPKKTANYKEWRTWAIISFMLSTGARAATVADIHYKDVDLANREVMYRHLKNKKVAVIPLSPAIVKALGEYCRTWETESEYLFCDYKGGKLTTSAIRQALIKYCAARGVEYKGVHALRHSFARNWIRNGGGAFELQRMLNHSDLATTRKYVELFSEDLKNALDLHSPLDKLQSKKITKIKK